MGISQYNRQFNSVYAIWQLTINQLLEGTSDTSYILYNMMITLCCPVSREGGGYSIYPLVGRCGAVPHTLTLFKADITDFPTLFKTEFRFLIPCLRQKLINRYPD